MILCESMKKQKIEVDNDICLYLEEQRGCFMAFLIECTQEQVSFGGAVHTIRRGLYLWTAFSNDDVPESHLLDQWNQVHIQHKLVFHVPTHLNRFTDSRSASEAIDDRSDQCCLHLYYRRHFAARWADSI